jgi:putative transposase
LGDTWHQDEVFITINGQREYLWRAVDRDEDLLDILVQPRRDESAAEHFFRRLFKSQGTEPRWFITDRLKRYGAAHQVVMPWVNHDTGRYANNRAEVSHRPDNARDKMRRFKFPSQAQRFCSVHGIIQICSEPTGISCGQLITDCYEIAVSMFGRQRQRH